MSSLANIKGFGSSLMGGNASKDPYSFSIDDEKKEDKVNSNVNTKPAFGAKKIENK